MVTLSGILFTVAFTRRITGVMDGDDWAQYFLMAQMFVSEALVLVVVNGIHRDRNTQRRLAALLGSAPFPSLARQRALRSAISSASPL